MKKLLLILLTAVAVISCAFALSACGDKGGNNSGHSHSYTEKIFPATCTEKGYTLHTCSCGESYKDTETEVLGHNYVNYVSDKNATCTEDGTKTAKCERCTETDTVAETDSKLGHSFKNYVSDKNATCTEDGTKTAKCDRCEETDTITDEGTKTRHKVTGGICEICKNNVTSKGLEYALSADGNSYSVSGIGECTDIDVIIPVKHNDLPVTSIGDDAFKDCSNIFSVTIPDSVTSIGISPFSGCTLVIYAEALEQPENWEEGWNSYCPIVWNCKNNDKAEDGYVYTVIKEVWYRLKDGEANILKQLNKNVISVDIPGNLTYNGEEYSVTYIITNAFSNCTLLTEVTVPDSVTTIDWGAFESCTSLTNIDLGKGLTTIGSMAFKDCTSLKELTIPDSVKSISMYAFNGCISLGSVVIPESVTSISGAAFDGCRWLTIYCETTEKPSSWSSDWNYANYPVVWDCKNNDKDEDGYAYSVIDGIRYGLKDGEATLVRQLGSILSADIPEKVTYKGEEYSVTSIAESAFEDCGRLTSVRIPKSMSSIGKYLFRNCIRLEEIFVDDENANYKSENNCLLTKDGKTLILGCKNSVIPYGVSAIFNEAFHGCESLTSVTIPDSMTSIGENAFEDCSSLTSITIPDSVTSIGEYAFRYCSALTIYCETTEKPSGWDYYWNYSNCPVIWDCKNNDRDEDGYAYSVIDGIRYGLKDGIATVVRQPRNITSAIIPEKVTYKGEEYSVTSIDWGAFNACYSLTSIKIPNSVTSIGYGAFAYCESLTDISFNGTKEQWGAIDKGKDWNYNTGSYTIHCTDGDIKK